MKKIKRLGVAFLALGFILGIITPQSVSANTYSGGETITSKIETVNQYTKEKLISGYVKDANGKGIANREICIAIKSSRFDATDTSKTQIIKGDLFYKTIKTDANGYYSFYTPVTGYYSMFLVDGIASNDEYVSVVVYGERLPGVNWLIDTGKLYKSSVRAVEYAIVR